VTVERVAYLGILAAAMAWSVLSAVLLVTVLRYDDRGGAWFWAAVYAASSLVADLCFWELP
jgi:hypothetical protein